MGFDSPEGYEKAGGFIGATIGRCANRIKDGKFELDGKIYQLPCNDGNNHLHGGKAVSYTHLSLLQYARLNNCYRKCKS